MRKSPRPGKPKIVPPKTSLPVKVSSPVKTSGKEHSLSNEKINILPTRKSNKEPSKINIENNKIQPKTDTVPVKSSEEITETEEYGIDFDFADMLYDFFKKENINGENKKLYSYIVDVFENKKHFDEEILDKLGIDKVIHDLDLKFKIFLKENEYENLYPPLTREILDIYLDVNLDQEYEDDGWVVKK